MGFNAYTIVLLFAAVSALNLGLIHFLYELYQRRLNFIALGAILFSICLGFYFYEVSGLYEKYPQILWINAPFLYLIGPCFYFHIVDRWRWHHLIHLLPFIYFLFLLYPFYVLPAQEKLTYYQQSYNPEFYQADVRQYLYLFSIGIYAFIGYWRIKKGNLFFYQNESDNAFENIHKKISLLYFLLGISALISFLVSLVLDYAQQYFYQFDYYVLSLITALILFLQFYFTQKGISLYFRKGFSPTSETTNKTVRSGESKDYQQLIKQLETLMKDEQLYLIQNLKITDVATSLEVSLHELSAAINQYYEANFFNYINKLRIAYLKTALLDPQNDRLTLFAIAEKAGFNSNSSFYRVFKQEVGCTPKAYIKQHRQSKSEL